MLETVSSHLKCSFFIVTNFEKQVTELFWFSSGQGAAKEISKQFGNLFFEIGDNEK